MLSGNDSEAGLAISLFSFLSLGSSATDHEEAHDHRPLTPLILTSVAIGIIIMKEGK